MLSEQVRRPAADYNNYIISLLEIYDYQWLNHITYQGDHTGEF